MPDYLPWPVPAVTTIYIAVYLLLENKQARGRFLISRAKTALHTLLGGWHDR